MNKLQILLLIALISFASTTYTSNLWVQSQDYKLKKWDSQWAGFLPTVYGGSGNYWYTWNSIPAGWQYYSNGFSQYSGYNDYIFWPYNINYGRYQCGLTVYDIVYKIQVKVYFVFDFNGAYDKFSVYTRDSYDPNYTYASTQNFQVKDLFAYPSWSKVAMLISDGDVRAIRQIIDRTLESDNDCQDKKTFLNGLIDRVNNFLTDNQNTIVGIQRSISTFESTIEIKKRQLNQLISELNYSGLSSLKIELNDLLVKAAWYQKKISQTTSQISTYNVQLKQYQDNIWKIQDVQIISLEREIATLQKKSQELIDKIRYEVGDVAWYVYEQKDVVLIIGKKKGLLETARQNVESYKSKIVWIKSKIQDLQSQITTDQIELSRINVKIAQVRAEIDAARDFSEINQDIEDIKMEIQDLTAKILAYKANIKKLEYAGQQIKEAQQEFTWTINKKLPYCGYQENVQVKDDYVGQWNYDRLDNYIYSIWGTYPKTIITTRPTYNVQNVDLFSTTWYNNYWGQSAYSYDNTFSCTGLLSKPAYYGVISRMGSNSIWVTDANSREWQLNFSSCSVLQSATGSSYPSIGNYIIWSGSRHNYNANTYQIRNAICL